MTLLAGIDFSCNPSRTKPVTLATGRVLGAVLHLEDLAAMPRLAQLEDWLRTPDPWLGAFDFPFGLPRAFVDANGLGTSCAEVIAAVHARCPTRMAWRAFIDAWGNTQPAGARLLHRRTDRESGVGSTSPLQTRYVPVGFMYYEGLSRLVAADVQIPGLRQGDATRTAVEGYPGLLSHELIGRRSYKNSPQADRLIARKDMVDALEQGRTKLALRLKLSHAQRETLVDDAAGDRLDAVLCLAQAAWASAQPRLGLPLKIDPVEGWIVGG